MYRIVTDLASALDLILSFLMRLPILDEFRLVIRTGLGRVELTDSDGEPLIPRLFKFDPREVGLFVGELCMIGVLKVLVKFVLFKVVQFSL